MFYLTRETIIEDRLRNSVSDDRAGAVCTFDGRVRNHNDGKPVTGLIYEAYEELAEREAQKIAEEALDKFDILHVACAHRTGELQIGDVAVFVAVSAAHRDQAFQACRYVIDEIKTRLPIWKKEKYTDGTSHWVNCQTCGHDATVSGRACNAQKPAGSRRSRALRSEPGTAGVSPASKRFLDE